MHLGDKKEVAYKSKTIYTLRYGYRPFVLSGVVFSFLILKFLMFPFLELEKWYILYVEEFFYLVLIIEILFLLKYRIVHDVLIYKKQKLYRLIVKVNGRLEINEDIATIVYYWNYVKVVPDKKQTTRIAMTNETLFAEIVTVSSRKLYLFEELNEVRNVPKTWEFNDLGAIQNPSFYEVSDIDKLKSNLEI